MRIYDCERKARNGGLAEANFTLYPFGEGKAIKCKWLDPYMSLFIIIEPGSPEGFLRPDDIEEKYPDHVCVMT